MKMELTGTFLILALLCGTTVALADDSKTRGASSEYPWETQADCESVTTIFRVAEHRRATVLVHVERERDDCCHDGDHPQSQSSRDNEPKGVILQGCGDERSLFVSEGETVQCVVEPAGCKHHHELKAHSSDPKHHRGTVQVIKI